MMNTNWEKGVNKAREDITLHGVKYADKILSLRLHCSGLDERWTMGYMAAIMEYKIGGSNNE